MFQSTHPRRVWHLLVLSDAKVRSFNPHTHEGCDVTLPISPLPWVSFNPHTHEGCDQPWGAKSHRLRVSIHTPTKGVTICCLHAFWSNRVSIHTPTKGVTILILPSLSYDSVSIHTPTKGVTAYSANGWISQCKDNYFAKDGKIITHKIS